MNSFYKKSCSIAFLLLSLTFNYTNAQEAPKEIKIGEQIWMVENLSSSTFRNGDAIPEAKTQEEWIKACDEGKPAWCYYENSAENGEKYGKLYNWYAVNDSRGLAPEGWHIPKHEEWTQLKNHLGAVLTSANKLKSKDGWEASVHPGTNSSGFSGLPSGELNYFKNQDVVVYEFKFIKKIATWWSATESPELPFNNKKGAYKFTLSYNYGNVSQGYTAKTMGNAVRCIKD